MIVLAANERQLLEKLAEAGRPTELHAQDFALGKILEGRGLVLFVRNSAFAVITPRGHHALAGEEESKPAKKTPPLGFLG
jgi:hypothetical protein